VKRKIAAILAADVVGYSKLVAEDEEDTLRRLETCRSVFGDFVARYGGRIFNTAGDAVLAEFPSSVEAVRCAVDVQESFRTRNLAYPSSRQMVFRIGITIGDVVEREGDLLGDGVNIAARLEGVASPGGICISHSVYEQVANKLSIRFQDIGDQHVKNIPNAIHAYTMALDDSRGNERNKAAHFRVSPRMMLIVGLAAGAAVCATLVSLLLPKPAVAPVHVSLDTSRGRRQAASSAIGSSSFDGFWNVFLSGNESCAYPNLHFRISVVNGQVQRSYPDEGKVDNAGNFEFTFPAKANPKVTVHFAGRLVGDSGDGTYNARPSDCAGRLQLTKAEASRAN
jgi:class 3 adenylate cyclase